jgi:hypothetical protein
MAFLDDNTYDQGLDYLDNNGSGGALHICSQEPTTVTEAKTTYTLGNKTAITITGTTAGSPSGRDVVVDAISGGSVTATGTATHWAVLNSAQTVLLATGPITGGGTSVTINNTFSLTAITVTFTDATAV